MCSINAGEELKIFVSLISVRFIENNFNYYSLADTNNLHNIKSKVQLNKKKKIVFITLKWEIQS